jgi:HlyD family secretion protein
MRERVAGAEAGYEKARTDARRYRMLFNEGAASAATRDAYNTAEKTALAELNTAKSQVTVAEREVQAREAAVAGAKEQIGEAEAELAARTATVNGKRKQLAAAEAHAAGGRSETETARRQLAVAQSAVRQAEAQLRAAQENVRQMKARRDEAAAGLRQARTAPRQVAVRKSNRAQSEARISQAQARIRELRTLIADNVIRAPVTGTVSTRLQDRGEVIAAGTPLLEVVNLDALYLKVYAPEDQIGKLRVGLPARIYTDAFPGKPFPATVKLISPRAEFTPKEVQTKAERVKLVYAVKLYLDANPDHRLTPGLPADAVIRWEPSAPWKAPRW